MKSMEAATKEAQKTVTALKGEAASVKARRDALAAELESLKAELKALAEQHLICEGSVKRLTAEVDALEQEVWHSLSHRRPCDHFSLYVCATGVSATRGV